MRAPPVPEENQRRFIMRKKRIFVSLALLLSMVLILAGFTACSSGGSSTETPKSTAVQKQPAAGKSTLMDAEAPEAPATAGDNALSGEKGQTAKKAADSPAVNAAAAVSNQKIIETLSYQIETLKFDDSVKTIQTLCANLGGYIQDSSVSGRGEDEENLRQASFTLRIPQEKLSQLKSSASGIGSILNFSSSSENISDKYYDTEARLKSLRTQQERLLALLQKSGALKDIIELEKALADVNYQIEELTGSLRQYDSLIDYSTVTIQLAEVVKTTELKSEPVSLGDKIVRQFQDSMAALGSIGEELLVFLIGCSPILILLAIIFAVVFLTLRAKKKRRKEAEPQADKADSEEKQP
jgi:hypothetical protein